MLPGFRLLFATVILSASILVFGLGAAALLRASHEEFASLPSWRLTQPPQFSPKADPAAPTLSMLRVETPDVKAKTDRLEAEKPELPKVEMLPQQAVTNTTPDNTSNAADKPDAAATNAAADDNEDDADQTQAADAPGKIASFDTKTSAPDLQPALSATPDVANTEASSPGSGQNEITSSETTASISRASEATAVQTAEPVVVKTNRPSARAAARRRAIARARAAARARAFQQRPLPSQGRADPLGLFGGGNAGGA